MTRATYKTIAPAGVFACEMLFPETEQRAKRQEEVCEEADDDTVFMKDAKERIIGFVKLNCDLAPGIPG